MMKHIFFLLLCAVWVLPASASETVTDAIRLHHVEVEHIETPKSTEEVQKLVSAHAGPICIGGGRYSQGGQIATENCLFLDMRGMNQIVQLDAKKKQITVQAGIRWRQIQEAIDPQDLSLRIMQSFSNFTVGGSLSVNAHGRYVGEGPLIGSVESIRIVLADGSVKDASRTLNPEIFRAAIGGYGGIGVITEATLNLVDNVKMERQHREMHTSAYPRYFRDHIRNSDAAIFHSAYLYPPFYSRMQAVTWSRTTKPLTVQERLSPVRGLNSAEQMMLGWVASGPLGKQVRQYVYDPVSLAKSVVQWRNHEASLDVLSLEPESRKRETDLLQEYFIPVAQFESFTGKMATILRRNKVNVLNISVRHAQPDVESLLSWAPKEVFAFVIYYRQQTGEMAQKKAEGWIGEMIDAAIAEQGTYYLPYQIVATKEQFHRAYPQAERFFALKAVLDPTNKFRNRLWDRYYTKPAIAGAK